MADAQLPELKADRSFRNELLVFLHAERGNHHAGWVTTAYLAALLRDPYAVDAATVDADRAHRLLTDLRAKGLAEHEDNREMRDESIRPDNQTWRITAKGASFVEKTADPDPDIDDGRRPRPRK